MIRNIWLLPDMEETIKNGNLDLMVVSVIKDDGSVAEVSTDIDLTLNGIVDYLNDITDEGDIIVCIDLVTKEGFYWTADDIDIDFELDETMLFELPWDFVGKP